MTLDPAFLKEGLKDGSLVPLLADDQIYLFVPDSDGQRFADLFRKTWNRLPGHATKRILRHWRADSPFAPVLRPSIELVGDWSGRCDMSRTSLDGNKLAFHKPSVDRMPDDLVETLIALELARVFDGAIVGYFGRDPLGGEERKTQTINSWGFSDKALGEWWLKNFRDKLINPRRTV